MEGYQFVFNEKAYELTEENCQDTFNDEVKPIMGFELSELFNLYKESEAVHFDFEYFDGCCEVCRAGKTEKLKHFKYLENHFYLFSKKGQYVMSSLSKSYEPDSFNQLLKRGIVDESYLMSVIVCINCGHYSVEIDYCDF